MVVRIEKHQARHLVTLDAVDFLWSGFCIDWITFFDGIDENLRNSSSFGASSIRPIFFCFCVRLQWVLWLKIWRISNKLIYISGASKCSLAPTLVKKLVAKRTSGCTERVLFRARNSSGWGRIRLACKNMYLIKDSVCHSRLRHYGIGASKFKTQTLSTQARSHHRGLISSQWSLLAYVFLPVISCS